MLLVHKKPYQAKLVSFGKNLKKHFFDLFALKEHAFWMKLEN
jgi:hypothetical protein